MTGRQMEIKLNWRLIGVWPRFERIDRKKQMVPALIRP
jgi:hypothetical protein